MAEEEEPPFDGRRGRRRKIGGTCRSFFNPDELLRSSPLPSQKATKRKKWLTEESVDIATSSLAIVPSASPSLSLSKRAGGRGGGGLSDPTPVKRRRSSKGFVWTDSDTDMEDAIEDLHKELEEERTATATAVSETMAMITRLQEERSALEMAANQYKRVAEEKEAHDKGTIALLEDLLMKEKEKVTRTLSRKRLPSQTLLIGNGNPEPDSTSDLDPECDPEYDPKFNPENDLEYDSEFDPEYDPEFDPENDPEFDPEFDSAYDPEFDSAYDPEYNPENDPEYGNDPKYNLESGLDDGDDEDGVELVEKRIISLSEMAPNFLDDEASTDSAHCLSITRNPSTEEFKPAKEEEEEEENTEKNYGSNNLKGFGIILPDSDNPSYLPSLWNRINEIEEKLQFLTRHQKETELSCPARSENKKKRSQEAKGQSYQSPNKVKDVVVDSHEAEHKDLAEAQEMRIVPDNLPSFGEQKNGKREEAWKTIGDEEELAVLERVEALKSEGERMMQEIDRLRKENEELKSVQDLGMQVRGGMKGGNVDESKASFAQTQKEGSLLVIIFKAFLSFIGLDRQKRKWEFPSRTRNAQFSQDKNRVLYWRINDNSPIIIKNKGNWSLNIAITANIEIC